MSTVTFPAVAGGATYTDDSDAATGLANGGHKTRFIPALKAVVDTAADVVVKSSTAAASAAAAAASAAYINGVAGGGTAAALAGSATQDFAAKTLTATTVNANNIGEITHSQGIVTTYAASGSSGIQIANNDNLNFGTGDFTLVWKGSLPDWTPAVRNYLLHKYLTGYGVFVTIEPSGVVIICIGNASAYVVYASTTPALSADGSVRTVAVSVVRETTTVSGTITFTVDGIQLGSVVTIPAGSTVTATNAQLLYVNGYSTLRQAATTQSCYAFNRALSADEVLSLHKSPYGVAESDKWGSQTELIYDTEHRFFTAGTSVWANNDLVSFDKTGDLSFTATAVGQLARCSAAYYPTAAGFKYRLQFDVSSIVGSWKISSYASTQTLATVSANGTNVFEFVAYDIGGLRFTSLTSDASGNFDNFRLTKLGSTLALEPEGIQPAPGQWLDSSSNKLHALQPATGSSLARKKEAFEIRWTNTWAGTSETQYIAGINQAIIPVNGYIESIVAVVTGTSVQNIIAGDGVDTDRWVTLTSGLTAGTQTLAIANRVSDGTNRKMTVAPSATATMSVSWVIRGVIL